MYIDKMLGEDWQTICPATLTQNEKADIKSALLENLRSGRLQLKTYLGYLKLISEYPETV